MEISVDFVMLCNGFEDKENRGIIIDGLIIVINVLFKDIILVNGNLIVFGIFLNI